MIEAGYYTFSELNTIVTLNDMLDAHLVLNAKATAHNLAIRKANKR